MGSPSSSLPSLMRNALVTPYTTFSSLLFSVLFVTIVWRNRSRRMHLLQYSAHAGRRTLTVEFLSALASCTLLLTIFLIPLLCIIGEYGLTRYFSLPVTGFLSTTMLWFDMNIGMYLFLLFCSPMCSAQAPPLSVSAFPGFAATSYSAIHL